MKKENIKDNPKLKPSLSWDLADYVRMGEEPPPCVLGGVPEGIAMGAEEVEDWLREEFQTLYVFRDEYQDKFDAQYRLFLLDLEYLYSLGKISKEDMDKLKDKESLNIGK